jgi:NADPH-dependent glutamate synthase beta subunit-like oxidoreductase/coenzyme F420-reducing hydrogenase delta subunit
MAANESRVQVAEVIDEASGKTYLPPCQVKCPINEDIQRTNAMLSLISPDTEDTASQVIKIGDEIYNKNPLFSICGYICGLCEKECNYKDKTGAITRKMIKRFITDYYLDYLKTKPAFPLPTKEKVAVIGGGPGSLMCAYTLGKKGYKVTIIDRGSKLGGALRYIPKYRLPDIIIDSNIDALVRIAHVDVKLGVKMGSGGKTLDDLKKEGYKAVFIATGTPNPRPLTYDGKIVEGADVEGVMYGLNLLSDVNQDAVSLGLFQGKKVIVVGGGNVAFDVARVARRLGGEVSLVCLECEDKSCKDGIPADVEEIEGASEEGIKIYYSRAVQEVISENGKFKKIKCPRCISVFDEKGFNPICDISDSTYIEGDILLVTIGQGADRAFLQQENLLNEKGRLEVDPLTLMSSQKEGVFIGGDVRRVGFAAEAMGEGLAAAGSIDRYLKGEDLKRGREKEFEKAAVPKRLDFKPRPEHVWAPVEERLNFEPFEKGYTPEEAIAEAKRCLYCGPCNSCKACVLLDFQQDIPKIELKEDACIRCGNCVYYCPYNAAKLESADTASFNLNNCHACGLCVVLCPAKALDLDIWSRESISARIAALSSEMKSPKILVFRCQWATVASRNGNTPPNVGYIDVPCAGRVDKSHILEAFQKGVDGVLVVACPEEDCHRGSGSRETKHSVDKLKERLAEIGLQDRLHFFTTSQLHPEEYYNEIKQFTAQIEDICVKESK